MCNQSCKPRWEMGKGTFIGWVLLICNEHQIIHKMKRVKENQSMNAIQIGKSVKEKWNNRRGKVVGVQNIEPIGLMYELSFGNQLWTECFWYSEIEEVHDEEKSMA